MIKKIVALAIFSVSVFAMGGPSLVETSKIVKDEVNPLQKFIGTIKFDQKSVLAAQNSGIVKVINFETGDKVKKNKTLVQIDADILSAQIKSARATAQSTKRDFERYTKLLENKSISQKEFDDIKVKYITAKSSLQELQIQAAKKQIKTPYSAVVIERHVDLGEWVNAGSPVATVVNTSKVEITFNIPLAVINGLKKDDIYEVEVGNSSLKAKLNAVIPAGDNLTRTFPVKFKANVEDSFVFDGQEAKVGLSKNKKTKALVVPRDAVIKRFGQNVVFIVTEKNTAQMIPVQIVAYLGSKIAIKGQGLAQGMDVVSKGNERVFPNSPVKVLNKVK